MQILAQVWEGMRFCISNQLPADGHAAIWLLQGSPFGSQQGKYGWDLGQGFSSPAAR